MLKTGSDSSVFPELPYESWKETYATLLKWTQIPGKIKLALMPMQNHWWNVPLKVSVSGLTTGPIFYKNLIFEIIFDFIDHELNIFVSNGKKLTFKLYPRSVSDFYYELMKSLQSLGIEVKIWTTPVEIEDRVPFDEDEKNSSYDSEYVHRFWLTLVQVNKILNDFKVKFNGKTSDVNFFWGSFDMSLSIYSGKNAPEYNGTVKNVAKFVMVEAMSKEEFTCGFWPGHGLGEAAFYSYAYPEPEGIRDYKVKPDGAYFSRDFGEFLLPYNTVRNSEDPEKSIHDFLWSTYEASAICGKWDRSSVEYENKFKN